MKKLVGLTLFVCSVILAVQFSGHQSLVNLGDTALFTAPIAITPLGRYFIQGNMSLPHKSTNGGGDQSEVVVTVYGNSDLLYTGPAGANGFMLKSVPITANYAVKVNLSSNAAVDSGLNVIKGDVFFGNSY